MARTGASMHLTPVDHNCNLFVASCVVSEQLQQKILNTPWLDLEFVQQPGQENWPRRLVLKHQLDWYQQWQYEFENLWPQLEQNLGVKLHPYSDTAFWIDEPGFTCAIHTDGELPGSLHLSWIGERKLGTTFYHSKNSNDVRFRHDFLPNSGYAMINMADSTGYRFLQWHGMLEPVPENHYRLTSYTWLKPVK